jgi:hypothetical protein
MDVAPSREMIFICSADRMEKTKQPDQFGPILVDQVNALVF